MNIPEYNNHDSGELCSGKGDTTMMKLQLTHSLVRKQGLNGDVRLIPVLR